jgi:hypothetical protein
VQPKLVEYSAAFRQSHPEEDKDPFKEPLDTEIVMRLGGGKQHGSYWLANNAISSSTTPTLREIRKAGSSSSSGIPIAPRRPTTYQQMEVSAVSFVVHSFHTPWLHIPCGCNIAGQVPGDDAGPAGGPGRGPPAELSGNGRAYQRQIADLAGFVKSKFPDEKELPPSLFAAPPLPVPAPVHAPVSILPFALPCAAILQVLITSLSFV